MRLYDITCQRCGTVDIDLEREEAWKARFRHLVEHGRKNEHPRVTVSYVDEKESWRRYKEEQADLRAMIPHPGSGCTA